MNHLRFFIIICVLFFFSGLLSCSGDQSGEKPLKIVCLGDSITSGHKLSDPAQQSYPAQLARQAGGKWQVLNAGKNGATVLKKGDIPITFQNVYQQAMNSGADVVVLMLGTNDTKNDNWRNLPEFIDDYVGLVKSLQQLPSHPYVISCSIPPVLVEHPVGFSAERVQEINRRILDAAAKSGADFLDIHASMSQRSELFTDGIHPNAPGAQEIAIQVFNKIKAGNRPGD